LRQTLEHPLEAGVSAELRQLLVPQDKLFGDILSALEDKMREASAAKNEALVQAGESQRNLVIAQEASEFR